MMAPSLSLSPKSTPPLVSTSALGWRAASSAARSSRWASVSDGWPSRVALPSTTMACTGWSGGNPDEADSRCAQNTSRLTSHIANAAQPSHQARRSQALARSLRAMAER